MISIKKVNDIIKNICIDNNLNYNITINKYLPNNINNNIIFTDGSCINNGKKNASAGIGVFYGDKDLSIFYNDVELIGENYILKSDSMTYNSFSKEAITFGFTEIKSEDSVMIESMGGVFRQETNYSKLSSSKVETDQYILEGDIINYDDENSIYYASKNVRLKMLKLQHH